MSPQWSRNLRRVYEAAVERAKEKLIQDTLDEANEWCKKSGKGIELGETSIRALYRLRKKYGPNSWISLDQMVKQSGVSVGKSPSRGLYIWDNEKGNGVVEKKVGHRQYRIVEEFYPHIEKVLKARNLQ